MVGTSFRDALGPLAARQGPIVREHEVLRVAATLVGQDRDDCADRARTEILRWAQKRCGSALPDEAWNFEDFDHMSGGRDSRAVRIRTATSDIWALRADDPDKTVPGRIWSHEVVIARTENQLARLSVRQLVSTTETYLGIEPHAPGFILQVADNCGLMIGTDDISSDASVVSNDDQAQELIRALTSESRRIPFLVLSVPQNSRSFDKPLVDAVELSRAVAGIGKVIILPDKFTWKITESLGRRRSVFGGAVRAYLPGFDRASDPYAHRLILAEQVARQDGPQQTNRWMRDLTAKESIRHSTLGRDVLPFSAVRNTALQLRQRSLSTSRRWPSTMQRSGSTSASAG